MDDLFSNPGKLIALLCIVGLVIGVNAPIIFAMGGRKAFDTEAKVFQTALRPGEKARTEQEKNMSDLHQRVQELKQNDPNDKPEAQ
jgi:hypothetical protein